MNSMSMKEKLPTSTCLLLRGLLLQASVSNLNLEEDNSDRKKGVLTIKLIPLRVFAFEDNSNDSYEIFLVVGKILIRSPNRKIIESI